MPRQAGSPMSSNKALWDCRCAIYFTDGLPTNSVKVMKQSTSNTMYTVHVFSMLTTIKLHVLDSCILERMLNMKTFTNWHRNTTKTLHCTMWLITVIKSHKASAEISSEQKEHMLCLLAFHFSHRAFVLCSRKQTDVSILSH